MKRRILALLLTLLTVLGMFPATALAASSEEAALGEIDIYSDGTELDYLSINGAARSQNIPTTISKRRTAQPARYPAIVSTRTRRVSRRQSLPAPALSIWPTRNVRIPRCWASWPPAIPMWRWISWG